MNKEQKMSNYYLETDVLIHDVKYDPRRRLSQ